MSKTPPQIKKKVTNKGISSLLFMTDELVLISFYDGTTAVYDFKLDESGNNKHRCKEEEIAKDSLYLHHLQNPLDRNEIFSAGIGKIDVLRIKKGVQPSKENFISMPEPENLYFSHLTIFNKIILGENAETNVLCALANKGSETENSSIFLYDLIKGRLLAEAPFPMRKAKIAAADSRDNNLIICISSLSDDEYEKLNTHIYLIETKDVLNILSGKTLKEIFKDKVLEQDKEIRPDKYNTVSLHPGLKYFAVGSFSVVDFYKIDRKCKNRIVLILSLKTEKAILTGYQIWLSFRINCIAAYPNHPDIIFAIADGYGNLFFFNLKKRRNAVAPFSIPSSKKNENFDFTIFKSVFWSNDGKFLLYERNFDKKYTGQEFPSDSKEICYISYEKSPKF